MKRTHRSHQRKPRFERSRKVARKRGTHPRAQRQHRTRRRTLSTRFGGLERIRGQEHDASLTTRRNQSDARSLRTKDWNRTSTYVRCDTHDHHASLCRIGEQGAPATGAGADVEPCKRHKRDQCHPVASALSRNNKCIPASKAEDFRSVIVRRNFKEKLRKGNWRKCQD